MNGLGGFWFPRSTALQHCARDLTMFLFCMVKMNFYNEWLSRVVRTVDRCRVLTTVIEVAIRAYFEMCERCAS